MYEKEKATEFGNRFNTDFQCFSSYITRFYHKHNIVFEKLSRKLASIPVGVSKIGWNTFGLICVKIIKIVTFIMLTKQDCFSTYNRLKHYVLKEKPSAEINYLKNNLRFL